MLNLAWIPAGALVLIFSILGLLHLYWAVGGTAGKASSAPTQQGKPVLNTGPLACVAVAALLFLAAVLCLGRMGVLALGPSWVSRVGVWGLAVVFVARAIGEFRYVGFFKKVRGTHFAHMDTVVYSPLCLGISALAVWLSLIAP